jgi:hypothetical protein
LIESNLNVQLVGGGVGWWWSYPKLKLMLRLSWAVKIIKL